MPTLADVQDRLRGLGYYNGKSDNKLGPITIAAILAALETSAARVVAPASAALVTSAEGRAAITQREGERLKSYQDSIGVWTIGVGHTSAAGPPDVGPNMTITAEQSDAILARDLAVFEKAVNQAVTVAVTQNEFDAMVSLAFNIGGANFAGSSVVKRLNAGDRAGAADAFLLWNKAGGKVLPGLTARRNAERAQFLGA